MSIAGVMTVAEVEEYEKLRHSHQGDPGWSRWLILVRKAESVGMVGIPPRLLTGTALPCGFPLRPRQLKTRLKHYRECSHRYCRWRAEAAIEIARGLAKAKGGG